MEKLNETVSASMNTAGECAAIWNGAANEMVSASNEMINQAEIVAKSTSALAESSTQVGIQLHGMVSKADAAAVGLQWLLQNSDKISVHNNKPFRHLKNECLGCNP